MKKILAAVALATMASHASAGWQCEAESVQAWGAGWGGSYSYARDRALMECAVRTSSWNTCWITDCWRTRGNDDAMKGEGKAAEKEAKDVKINPEPGKSKSGYMAEG